MLMSIWPAPVLRTRQRRRDERQEETRLLLLQAAARLFAHHGYDGVSLDAVAGVAGFSKGAVYAHFSSKHDLLANLLETYCERQHSRTRSVMAGPGRAEERIEQAAALYFDRSEETRSWSLLFFELWLQAVREQSLRPRLEDLHRMACLSVAEMVRQEAERRGADLAVPAEDVASAVLALGNGLVLEHVLSPDERIEQIYITAVRAIFDHAVRPKRQEAHR